MREHARAADVVARVGGEEFVVVLPECDAADAARFAERIRGHLTVDLPTGVPTVTVSAGVAAAHTPVEVSSLLRASDAALYAAKQAGRDRVVVAPGAAAERSAA